MEKVQNAKAEAQKNTQKNEHAADVDAKKEAEFKAKKAEAAKRFKEHQAELKKETATLAGEMLKVISDKKYNFDQKYIDLLNRLANGSNGSNGGSTFFNKVFGDNPKVGDSITLLEYMKKTLKAKADLDRYVKDWAKKGTVVEFVAAANMLESKYVIKAIA